MPAVTTPAQRTTIADSVLVQAFMSARYFSTFKTICSRLFRLSSLAVTRFLN
jgi:hypothetical protein